MRSSREEPSKNLSQAILDLSISIFIHLESNILKERDMLKFVCNPEGPFGSANCLHSVTLYQEVRDTGK